METLLACLNHFPLFAIMLRLKDPDRLPGGLRIEVCPERFFFDRATPLRWVVSSLRSVSSEYPQQQQQQLDGLSNLNLDQRQSFRGKQDPHSHMHKACQQQQNPMFGETYGSHVGASFIGDRDLDDNQGVRGNIIGVDKAGSLPESASFMVGSQERIPRTVSYLFLTVRIKPL